jgi:hypothetical protein
MRVSSLPGLQPAWNMRAGLNSYTGAKLRLIASDKNKTPHRFKQRGVFLLFFGYFSAVV